eukprot:11519194-Heterocapsa_arctica.AAC.1
MAKVREAERLQKLAEAMDQRNRQDWEDPQARKRDSDEAKAEQDKQAWEDELQAKEDELQRQMDEIT